MLIRFWLTCIHTVNPKCWRRTGLVALPPFAAAAPFAPAMPQAFGLGSDVTAGFSRQYGS